MDEGSDDMINSAKILKLCNDIEDIVTDMDVHCTQAGWTECMEIISKIKQIGEELAEQPITNGDYIRLMTDEELADALGWGCACCVYRPVQCKAECREGRLKWLKQNVGEVYQAGGTISKERFAEIGGADNG